MGLLARAEAYLEMEAKMRLAAEQKMAEEQMALAAAIKARPTKTEMVKSAISHIAAGAKTAKTKLKHMATDFKAKFQTTIKKAYQPQLRRYAATILALGLSLQTIEPRTMNHHDMALQQWTNWDITPRVEVTVPNQPKPTNFSQFRDFFTKDIHRSIFTEQDRDDLARLLYGEAGRNLADAVEVLHTVLNRYASPLFKGNMHEIITAKNQYVGYSTQHPVDRKLRALVDYVIDEWEAHGCQAIDHCDHYYFRTGDAGICNQFEIAPAGSQGRWVKPAQKQFEEKGHYCPNANDQAVRFENHWRSLQANNYTRLI